MSALARIKGGRRANQKLPAFLASAAASWARNVAASRSAASQDARRMAAFPAARPAEMADTGIGPPVAGEAGGGAGVPEGPEFAR